jgi:hypothetical protein
MGQRRGGGEVVVLGNVRRGRRGRSRRGGKGILQGLGVIGEGVGGCRVRKQGGIDAGDEINVRHTYSHTSREDAKINQYGERMKLNQTFPSPDRNLQVGEGKGSHLRIGEV